MPIVRAEKRIVGMPIVRAEKTPIRNPQSPINPQSKMINLQ